jgi:regulator of RNase E activity RraA
MSDTLSNVKHISAATFETLRKYDSATIFNVIELFEVRPSTSGYVKGSIKAVYPDLPVVVGYATTATFRSAYPSSDENAYLRVSEHVERMREMPEPRIVVIQDLDEPPLGATLGEVMCRVYKTFGASGIITSGAARDILGVRQLRFPVFASSIIVSHGYPRLEEIHIPVHIHGLTVRPGDIIHADANGVLSIPEEIAEDVAQACADFMSIERIVIEYLDRKDATPEGYREAEKQAADLASRLSLRLRNQIKNRSAQAVAARDEVRPA